MYTSDIALRPHPQTLPLLKTGRRPVSTENNMRRLYVQGGLLNARVEQIQTKENYHERTITTETIFSVKNDYDWRDNKITGNKLQLCSTETVTFSHVALRWKYSIMYSSRAHVWFEFVLKDTINFRCELRGLLYDDMALVVRDVVEVTSYTTVV